MVNVTIYSIHGSYGYSTLAGLWLASGVSAGNLEAGSVKPAEANELRIHHDFFIRGLAALLENSNPQNEDLRTIEVRTEP